MYRNVPHPRDIVLYKTLPNEMPRVAGIITGVRQTPLSHVNLRAIQDQVPNAFISEAWKNRKIAPLIGKYVYYRVDADGFDIREAKPKRLKLILSACVQQILRYRSATFPSERFARSTTSSFPTHRVLE